MEHLSLLKKCFRFEEAWTIMESAARFNGRPAQPCDRAQVLAQYQKKPLRQTNRSDINHEVPAVAPPTLLELLRYPGMRRNFLILCFMWFSYNLGYYGLVYNTPAFGWNVYLVFVFPACFTIPVILACPWLENHLGRKFVITVPLFLAGLACMATMAVPKGSYLLNRLKPC